MAAWDCFGFVRPALVCAPDPAARRLELHLLRLGNHVQHRYFPAFGCGADRVAGPFQDAVSPSFDPVDILCYAAFGRHQEACPASPPPTSVQPRVKGVLLRGLLLRRFSYLDILSKQGSVYLVLCVFPIMYGVQILLDFSIGCPMVSFNLMPDPPLERHAFLIMSGEISGAFLASSLIAFFPSHSLLVPMLGLSLFGCGSLLTAVFPSPPLNSVAFYIMQLSSGCCAAFGLFVLHQFFQRSGFLFRTLSKALFLLTLFGSMGGYLLWKFVDNIHNSSLSSHVLFMHLLTIGAILGLFFVYLIRRPLQHLMVTAPRRSLEEAFVPAIQEDPFEQLTPREREVAELVQTGMKNLEISAKLNITETTLRVHLRRIYRKLGIQGRSNLRDFNAP